MREQISKDEVNQAVDKFIEKLFERLAEKGYGTFSSMHEILGVVAEEYHELIGAVTGGDHYHISDELLDVAVACIFGLACIDNGTADW